jgi:hypothetical protein
MTSLTPAVSPGAPTAATGTSRRHRSRAARSLVGGLFLVTGGVHLGIVAADTELYRHFADDALFPFVRDRWADVFMAGPALWGLCLMAGEIGLGTLLLLGGRWAKVGWLGVIAFQVLLVLFGVGFLPWSVPALLVFSVLAVRDWPRLSPRSEP